MRYLLLLVWLVGCIWFISSTRIDGQEATNTANKDTVKYTDGLTQAEIDEAIAKKRQKDRHHIRGEYEDNYKILVLSGTKEDLKDFADRAMDIVDKNWQNDQKMLTERARVLKYINLESKIYIVMGKYDGTTANVQKCIDAWPGEFDIWNELPTGRRCQKLSDLKMEILWSKDKGK